MHKPILFLGICGLLWAGAGLVPGQEEEQAPKKKILMYSQSDGFRHGVVRRPLTGELSFAEGIFKEIATKAGYEVFVSQCFHDLRGRKDFDNYDAIVFYSSGDVKIDKEALYAWTRDGGAFIGIHSATDTWKGDPEYVNFIGGAFKTHGAGDREVTLKVEDRDHPATRMLGAEWKLVDEIYHHENFSRDNMHVLISVDTEKTDLGPQRMEADGDYPVAWTRTEGNGRVFYTALGHRNEVWEDSVFQEHLLAGIAWALREKNGDQ